MKIVVIGAGIAGLGAAYYFSRLGHDVTVLEASHRPGGRAITWQRPGTDDIVDTGTQYFHSSYVRALELIRHTGLDSSLKVVGGHTRVFDERVKGGSFLFNRRLPWYTGAGVTGNLQLGWFLLTHLIRYPVNLFGLDIKSAGDTRQVNDYAEVINDSIIRPLSQVGSLSEPDAMNLSLNHLMRLIHVVLYTDYLSLSRGTAALHTALASRFRVRYEAPVAAIIERQERTAGIELAGSGEFLAADHIVVATTPDVAATLLPADWTEERHFLQGIRIPAFTLPTFFLDRPLEKNVWSYLLHQLPGSTIAFMTDAAMKNPAMVPSGKSVIQPWVCYPQSVELAGLPDADVISRCIREIEQQFPGFGSWVEHVHLTRHPAGVPFHSAGHIQRAIDFRERTDKRGISFCGDYLSGGYMESALWSADRAARVHGSVD